MNERELALRDIAIREIGCIASWLWGYGFAHCEKHHLNEFDQHGKKRRGEAYTIGLSPWSHRGICSHTGGQWDCPQCKAERGPSWHHHKREFVRRFGTGDEILEIQNRLIANWKQTIVGAALSA